ncbi:MAG: hypothetical protein ACOY7J_11515 [Pseudomonadota bacterium]
MNINTGRLIKAYSEFLVTKIADKETVSTAVDVPWGYYIASQQRRILTRVMTTCLNSCIGYLFWDKVNCNFLFAHISTNGETCSAISLVKELSNGIYGEGTLFVCITGKMPTDSTAARINHLINELGQPHRCFNAPSGGVRVDLSLETIVETTGPAAENIRISKDDKIAAMKKDDTLPLYAIDVSNSWVGAGTLACSPVPKPKTQGRARASSLSKNTVL